MVTLSKPRVTFREAQFEDHQAIAALESAHGLAAKPFDEWRRLWVGNPCYTEIGPNWPIGWVLEDANRVVGCSCNIPLPYVFRGRKLVVASGRGWVVDDAYRGYAPLLVDEYFNQENVDLFLNNTVNGRANDVFNTFGSLRVPVGDWEKAAFTITNHRPFAESALRIKGIAQPHVLSYPVGLAISLRDRLTRKPTPKSDIEVTVARDFDPRFDTLWQSLSERSNTLLAVRSLEVLQWHFGNDIDKERLWVLTAARDSNMNAYAVFQRRDEPQYGLKRIRMVDFQASENHDEYCAALVQRAYHECRMEGIHVLEHVGCDLETTRIFDRFAPYRRKLPGWPFFYLTRDKELADLLARPQAWRPSSYDGDASL